VRERTGLVQIVPYTDSLRNLWDGFIPETKNRSFMFMRGYMDYHRDRFEDRSLFFLVEGRLRACLPANVAGRLLHSHQGLTFGGLLMHRDIRLGHMRSIMAALRRRLADDGLEALIYRPMPFPYHDLPAEEDIVALTAEGGTIQETRATLCLRAGHLEQFSENRREDLARGARAGLTLRRSDEFAGFMMRCAAYLKRRHGARPVHSEQEMVLLAQRFPDNIQLYVVERAGEMLAGLVLYRHGACARLQYFAEATDDVPRGAVGQLYGHLLGEVLPADSWLDFGHSHDPAGQFNEGVHLFKESFGARTVSLATYRLEAG
jgi:hypothetical protein